jgi:hypothetical protein
MNLFSAAGAAVSIVPCYLTREAAVKLPPLRDEARKGEDERRVTG